MTRLAGTYYPAKTSSKSTLRFSKSLLCNLGPGDSPPGLFCCFTYQPAYRRGVSMSRQHFVPQGSETKLRTLLALSAQNAPCRTRGTEI
jgi:hypothetical protein